MKNQEKAQNFKAIIKRLFAWENRFSDHVERFLFFSLFLHTIYPYVFANFANKEFCKIEDWGHPTIAIIIEVRINEYVTKRIINEVRKLSKKAMLNWSDEGDVRTFQISF